MATTQFLLEVQFWFPLWLVFLLHLGFDLVTAVVADGAFRIVSVLAEIPMGKLADRMGRKGAYLLTSALAAVTFSGMAMISSTVGLFAVWTLWGVLWALNSGAAASYAYELSLRLGPGKNARGFAFIRGMGQAAVLVSLVTAGWLYELGPTLPFWLTAAFAALAGGLALSLPTLRSSTNPPRLIDYLRSLRAIPGARSVIGIGVVFMAYGWSVRILFQPLAIDLGLAANQISAMYALAAAVGMVAAMGAGWLRAPHRRNLVSAGLAVTALASAATWLWPTLGPWIWLPALSLAWGAGWTSIELELSDRTPPSLRATIFSLVSCLAGTAIAIARPGLGILADARGAPAAFGAWAGIGIVTWILGLLFLSRFGKPPRPGTTYGFASGS